MFAAASAILAAAGYSGLGLSAMVLVGIVVAWSARRLPGDQLTFRAGRPGH